MNSSNPTPSKKKKRKKQFQRKLLVSGVVGMRNDFDIKVDTDDNIVKVTCKIVYSIFATNLDRSQSKRFAWIGSR